MPSSTAMKSWCARRTAASNACCTFGRPRAVSVSADQGRLERRRDRRGERLRRRRQPLLERLADVDVLVELVDEVDGDRAPDVGVLDELRARVREVVRVSAWRFTQTLSAAASASTHARTTSAHGTQRRQPVAAVVASRGGACARVGRACHVRHWLKLNLLGLTFDFLSGASRASSGQGDLVRHSPEADDAPRAGARNASVGGKSNAAGEETPTMMMRRRRPLMRAAMVGGVAYHAGKKVQQGREEDAVPKPADRRPPAAAAAATAAARTAPPRRRRRPRRTRASPRTRWSS